MTHRRGVVAALIIGSLLPGCFPGCGLIDLVFGSSDSGVLADGEVSSDASWGPPPPPPPAVTDAAPPTPSDSGSSAPALPSLTTSCSDSEPWQISVLLPTTARISSDGLLVDAAGSLQIGFTTDTQVVVRSHDATTADWIEELSVPTDTWAAPRLGTFGDTVYVAVVTSMVSGVLMYGERVADGPWSLDTILGYSNVALGIGATGEVFLYGADDLNLVRLVPFGGGVFTPVVGMGSYVQELELAAAAGGEMYVVGHGWGISVHQLHPSGTSTTELVMPPGLPWTHAIAASATPGFVHVVSGRPVNPTTVQYGLATDGAFHLASAISTDTVEYDGVDIAADSNDGVHVAWTNTASTLTIGAIRYACVTSAGDWSVETIETFANSFYGNNGLSMVVTDDAIHIVANTQTQVLYITRPR